MKIPVLIVSVAALVFSAPVVAEEWRLCRDGERNGPQKRWVVDGDTLWVGGLEKSVRLERAYP